MTKNRAGDEDIKKGKPHWLTKFAWVMLAASIVVAGAACGGGGGGGTSTTATTATTATSATATNTTTTGSVTDVHITGTLASSANQGIDPADVVAGTQVQLQVLALNSSGQWTIQSASNWRTNAPSSVAAVNSSGLLTAVAPGGPYTISCTGPLGSLSTPLNVEPASQPTVTGLVQDQNGLNITQVYIYFYNSAGTQVAESVTGTSGTFLASVPASAVGFTVNVNVADPLTNGTSFFYRQFEYGSTATLLDYLEQDTGCLAPLPALKSGTNPLPYAIVLDDRANGPPPPPTGCG